MKKIILSAGLAIAFSVSAMADNQWTDVTAYTVDNGSYVGGPLTGNEIISAGCQSGYYCSHNFTMVPIAEFVNQSQLEGIFDDVDLRIEELETAVAGLPGPMEFQILSDQVASISLMGGGYGSLDNKLNRVGALSAVMNGPLPQSGSHQRLGGDIGTFNGETAFGLNYTAVKGKFDFSVGYGQSGSESLGRIGGGISW